MRPDKLFFLAKIIFVFLFLIFSAPTASPAQNTGDSVPQGKIDSPDSKETNAVLYQKYFPDPEKIAALKKKVYEMVVITEDPYSVCFGSGVIFEQNGRLIIITCNHILEKGNKQKKISARDHTGQIFNCKILATVPGDDLAVLEIEDPHKILPETVVRPLGKVGINEMIYACGYYSGIPFVKIGRVLAFQRKIETDTGPVYNTIFSDATVGHGFSGGPVLNEKNELVGIVVALDPETNFSNFSSFENIYRILNKKLPN